MSQPHLSNNLDKIIQMISIEQLLGLMKQMKSCDTDTNANTNANANINTNVLSSPIVKNVINAYEQEIKALTATANAATINTNTNIIPFAAEITKITEQLDKINNNLLVIVEKINSMETDFKTMQNNKQVSKLNDDEEHIKLKIEERDIKENDAFESINIADDDCESDCSDDEFIKEIKASLAKMEEGEAIEEDESAQAIVSEEDEELVVSAQAEEESAQAIVADEEELVTEEEDEEELVADEEELVTDEEEEEESDTEPEISDDSDEDVKEVSKVEEVKEIAQEEIESVQVIEEEEEEEEEEVFEIEIDDITYYATHEENGNLYEVDKDGEVGKKVGIIKDGEPIFS